MAEKQSLDNPLRNNAGDWSTKNNRSDFIRPLARGGDILSYREIEARGTMFVDGLITGSKIRPSLVSASRTMVIATIGGNVLDLHMAVFTYAPVITEQIASTSQE